MSLFQIRLFGAIEVLRDGQPLTKFRSQKTLTLLAYLLSQNRPFTRDHLAGLFWPEASQPEALGHLRRALHNLSKNLPDCLDITRRTVAFRADALADVDIHRAADLLAQTDPAALAEAADLLRAPFLEGVYFADCRELEAWIATEQERWRQQAITLLNQLVETAVCQGEYGRALPYARRLVRLDPLTETHHHQLMQIYAKTGSREAALAQFTACRDLLAAELDLSPSPALIALHQRLHETTAVRHNLPPAPTPFIGRQKDITTLRRMLANPDCRLITLAGPGGIGKTRLAMALAGQCANHFLEGIWFINLVDVATPAGLLTALGITLDLPFLSGREPARQLLDYLQDKEMVLVWDNYEQLADNTELAAAILEEAPFVKLVVTSRVPLNLQEEWIYDLDGLPIPLEGEFDSPQNWEAIQLFNESARRRSPQFDPAANETAVIEICRITQGMPLALEMAAAACRDMSCAAIAAGISANLDNLQTPLRNVPERHRSVQAVFNHSWQLLDKDAQSAYARLALFRGSFSAAAAEAVTQVGQNLIRRLADHSLLKPSADSRYELHDLLRKYAWDKLEQNQALANQMAFNHAEYFMARLVEYGANDHQKTHTAVTPDLRNIITAWHWAASHGQWHLMMQSAGYLRNYFLEIGSSQEGIVHLDSAIDQLEAALAVPARQPQPPEWLHGRLLAHKAHLLVRTSQNEPAYKIAKQVQAMQAQTPDPAADVEAKYVLAMAEFARGNYGKGLRLAEIGIQQAQEHEFPLLAAICRNHAGRCHLESGDLDAAERCFAETAVQSRAHHFLHTEIAAAINLGLVANSRGMYQQAQTHLQNALAQAEKRGYHALLGIIHLNLGTVCFHLGEYAAGQAHYQAAGRAYRHLGNRSNLGLSHQAQAIVALEMGDFLAARAGYAQALALYDELGSRHRQLIIQGEMGHVLGILGQFTAAEQHMQKAFALLDEMGEVNERLNVQAQAAWLALEMGDLAQAEALLAQAAALLPDCQIAEQQCLVALMQSCYAQYRGQLAEAQAAGEQALALARQKERRKLPDCAIRLGYVLAARGEPAAARPLFAEALQIREERNQPHLAAEARAGLALAALAGDELATAVAHVEAILQFLDRPTLPNSFLGLQEPGQAYLTCFRVLQAAGDGRGTAVLEEALAFLQKRAAGLEEARQRVFWQNIPAHRQLQAAGKA